MTNLNQQHAIVVWQVQYWSAILGLPAERIDPHRSWNDYEVTSVEIVQMVQALERHLGREFSPTLCWQYTCMQALAAHLADDGAIAQAEPTPAPPNAIQPHAAEPIAIIGMACRLPGASNTAAFWCLLSEGRSAIGDVPADRWRADDFHIPCQPVTRGKVAARKGGFLPNLDQFDPEFFGISPREAPHVDPRQRLMLELAYEVLQDAGISIAHMSGQKAGVYVSVLSDDYNEILFTDLKRVEIYSGTGTANSIVSNRLSYWLDLHGPSMSVDTACSGSLVATHLACEALRRGECESAFVGGVNINLLPNGFVFFSQAGALSPDSQCKAFDAKANGIARSEGAALLLLKPLSKAIRDGDSVHAVILGTGINHDGRTNGIMAPNGEAQRALLRDTYARAGVAPSAVQYIEAHGTGTPLGDPIEVQALADVLSAGRQPGQRCAIGSAKTNIGHAEAAAGAAGLVKVVLALQHKLLPPSLHFENANPLIPFADTPFVVQQQLGAWPNAQAKLIAGVSGFGFGGTNAHIILGEAPKSAASESTAASSSDEQLVLLPLSARTPAALIELAQHHLRLAQSPHAQLCLHDASYTAARRRDHFECRLAVQGKSWPEIAERLEAALANELAADAATLAAAKPPAKAQPKVAFVFSGQGSLWREAGLSLYAQHPVFRQSLDACEQLIQQHAGWSLLEKLRTEEPMTADAPKALGTHYEQPMLFALQVALNHLWRHWGVTPSVIVGQSAGEVAAAYAAGALSLSDAVRVIVGRSTLMRQVEGQGKTAVVELPLEKMRLVLAAFDEDDISVAGWQSANTTVISGKPETVQQIIQSLEKKQVFCRLIPGVEIAFHSAQMDALCPKLRTQLAAVQPLAAHTALLSTVTGDWVTGDELNADYWVRNLREPFQLATALQKLAASPVDVVVEISPHAVLTRVINENLKLAHGPAEVIGSPKRGQDPCAHLLGALGQIYRAGCALNWPAVAAKGKRVPLPAYPWQRERYWLDQLDVGGAKASRVSRRGASESGHPLLGERFQVAGQAQHNVWEMDWDADTLAYLKDHHVNGFVLMPGAAYAEMGHAVGASLFGATAQCQVKSLAFHQPLTLAEGERSGLRRMQVVATANSASCAKIEIYSCLADDADLGPDVVTDTKVWVKHASGIVEMMPDAPPSAWPIHELLASNARHAEAGATHYAAMAANGLHYGPAFQVIESVWANEDSVVAKLRIDAASVAEPKYHLHPTWLDGAFQAIAAAARADEAARLPTGVGQVAVLQPKTVPSWVYARRRLETHSNALLVDIDLMDASGHVLAIVRDLRLESVQEAREAPEDWCYGLAWEPLTVPAQTGATPTHWLILSDARGVGQALADTLAREGKHCVRVCVGQDDDAQSAATQWVQAQSDLVPALDGALRSLALPAHATLGLVHLFSLNAAHADQLDEPALTYANWLTTHTLMTTAQWLLGLGRMASAQLGSLVLVTRGAQQTQPTDRVAFAQAPVWGMGRSLSNEHPELNARLIDLDPTCDDQASAQALVALLGQPPQQVAVRQGGLLTPVLQRQTRTGNAVQPVTHAEGAYLITGGLGALGGQVAHWLADHGARRLILMSRQVLPARHTWAALPQTDARYEAVALVRGLEQRGVAVHLASVNVSNREQLGTFLAQYAAEGWPAIRGVFHLAGITDDQLLMRMTPDALNNVLAPKVLGAWWLHQHLKGQPLDLFVAFSSAASVIGSVGQANYAAANAFLDALMHERQNLGMPAISLNWGPWADAGMAAGLQMANSGVHHMQPAQALAAMHAALAQPAAQQVILSADWEAFMRHSAASAFLKGLCAHTLPYTENAGSTSAGQARPVRSEVLQRLLHGAAGPDRTQQVEGYLCERVGQVLRVAPVRLNTGVPLNALGFDSVMALEVRNRIEADTGIKLSLADMLQGGSLSWLAGQLAESVNALAVPDAGLGDMGDLDDLLEELTELPMEEVEALFASVQVATV